MRKLALVTLLALAWSAPAFAQGTPDDQLASPKLRVEWTEFKKLYDAKAAIIVDVRDAASFESGHIPGARSMPLASIETHVAELKKLGKPIITYCA